MKINREPTKPCDALADFIEDMNITIKDLANHLGFSRETISRVIHGKQPITFNLAHSLEQSGIGSARVWLSLQLDYDLWVYQNARPNSEIKPIFLEEPTILHNELITSL